MKSFNVLQLEKSKLKAEFDVMNAEYARMKESIRVLNEEAAKLHSKIYANLDKQQKIADDLLEIEFKVLKENNL